VAHDGDQDPCVAATKQFLALLESGVRRKKLDAKLATELRGQFTQALKLASDLVTFWQNKAEEYIQRAGDALDQAVEESQARAEKKFKPSDN
jgi:hypothetical protein